jgi:hypothetical protein
MSNFLLSKSEQGIVVFHLWKSMKYNVRLTLSILLILSGFILQYEMLNVTPGILLVLAGNLFLLVKGYDTRIKLDKFKPDAEWVKTDAEQLSKIVAQNSKIEKWDKSALDITSSWGCLTFFILIGLVVALFVSDMFPVEISQIIGFNFAVLFLPHWLSGLKRISTAPVVLTKIKLFQKLTEAAKKELENETVNFLMLVDEKTKFPTDVKMKISFKDQSEDFMGFYGQISMNNVQGTLYPYFYVVLVAKDQSKLLGNNYNAIETPDNVIKELQAENDMEIVVIRQKTTKTSGYQTTDKAVFMILETGISAVKKIFNK